MYADLPTCSLEGLINDKNLGGAKDVENFLVWLLCSHNVSFDLIKQDTVSSAPSLWLKYRNSASGPAIC